MGELKLNRRDKMSWLTPSLGPETKEIIRRIKEDENIKFSRIPGCDWVDAFYLEIFSKDGFGCLKFVMALESPGRIVDQDWLTREEKQAIVDATREYLYNPLLESEYLEDEIKNKEYMSSVRKILDIKENV